MFNAKDISNPVTDAVGQPAQANAYRAELTNNREPDAQRG